MEPNLSPAYFIDYADQNQSGLFSVLPPEIRSEIFAFALASAPDTTQPIGQDEYCTRPGYETRHFCWTQLLRTCKRVYMEAWFMPFIWSEHTFYMARAERSPRRTMSVEKMQECLDLIHRRHGEVHGGHVRLFAQLFMLENSRTFMGLFTMHHFHPTSVTITLRYTDTWEWEGNRALHISGKWCKWMVLPESVTSFKMDIESIERRKEEVDYIANEAAEKWHFKRTDGTNLLAQPSDISISQWTGSSILGSRRWVRDEVRPGQLDYYVATVTWRPSRGSIGARPERTPDLTVKWTRPLPRNLGYDCLPEDTLQRLNISMDTPAEEAVTQFATLTVTERSLVLM
ncbi:uncharacterized protein N7498_009182 [Penicillium cinerascens]|uniref:Uncharacterized protein n=1 Tax=Penicillium cinerascens TaxID=70096 RepID=A0A9W9J5V0_9EURO|nr:uncharacterized protein N7498_009182 [Penicillium cinerascens]KAJ5190197.1 hypothetical protein N7498_009182 [Penicillium cinerascens]